MVIDYDIILGGTLGMYLKPGDIDLLHQLIQNRTAFPFSQPFIRIATQTNVPPAKGAALQFVTAYLNSVMGTVTY